MDGQLILGIKGTMSVVEINILRLRLLAGMEVKGDERRVAVAGKIEQLEYEVRRSFEQYNEADPRNRLVAAELERRWEGRGAHAV